MEKVPPLPMNFPSLPGPNLLPHPHLEGRRLRRRWPRSWISCMISTVNQVLAKSLMVEFLRLKLITGDDLSTTLQTWYADMEATTEEFLRDVDSATQTSTALPSKNATVQAALHKYQEAAKLKLALPLSHLGVAQEEMEKFIQFHLQELQSQQETKNLIRELSSRITDHRSKVCRFCTVNL